MEVYCIHLIIIKVGVFFILNEWDNKVIYSEKQHTFIYLASECNTLLYDLEMRECFCLSKWEETQTKYIGEDLLRLGSQTLLP